MIKKMFLSTVILLAALGAVGCGSSSSSSSPSGDGGDGVPDSVVALPAFDGRRAYDDVSRQVAFGPRVPGSEAHRRCADWIDSCMRAAGADTVFSQTATVDNGRGGTMPIRNVFARFNADAPTRILLLAHYDTRPWADQDPDHANHATPIDGANDGGSGVGLLTAMSSYIAANPLPDAIGVDMLFTDGEDSGVSDGDDPSDDLTWCLGTRYFARHLPYRPGHLPRAAVLLDMVGARNAVFRQEYFGMTRARNLAENLWKCAAEAGKSSRFDSRIGGAVNDDHLPLLDAGIPAVDIIEIGHPETGSFHPSWHTLGDNMSVIDSATLADVGDVLVYFIYRNRL